MIYKTNLYSISSDLTINNRYENILVNINNLHLDNDNWKDNSISINKSHLIIKDDSINFDINSILETNVAILAKGNLLFENNQINFLNSKLEVKDSLHNLLMLDDIQAYIDLNQNQLKVDANSNLKSNLLKGDLNFEMNFKNNNINFNADLLEGPNNLIFNGNYNLSSNIWIVKTSIDNYLINYDEFEPSISGVIDFYGKKLDLINTEINISLIENNNNIMIDNVYGKINYKDSLFFSIGDIVFRNDDFVVLMSDLNVSKNDLVFNSIVDFK